MAEDNTSPAQEAKTMQSETLVEEFSRLVREYKQDDGPGGIEAWNLIADFAVDNADAIEAALSAAEPAIYVSRKSLDQLHAEGSHVAVQTLIHRIPLRSGNGVALYAAPPAPSVAVKALEWESPATGPDEYALITNTKIMEFRYEVRRCDGMKTTFTVTRSRDIQPFAWRDTIEGAKAAAQADYDARIRSALSAQVQDVAGWQPIETAPHDTNVLLAWADSTLPGGWKMEAGVASWGWRRDGVSNMSEHGQATHWMPLPSAPAAPAKQEG